MIIAIFPNETKHPSLKVAIDICKFLASFDIVVVAEDHKAEDIGALPLSSVHPKEIHFMISLGGDGTILRLLHSHPEIEAPLIGINIGGLGFMADVPLTDIYASLQDLIEGSFQIQERLVMEGESVNGETCFSVNDIVVHRAHIPSLVDLAMYVDGSYLNTFSADGIIIATPGGSTAYSLAAGGPIITPNVHALVITPISPHTISNRPIVLMPKEEIRIQYLSENRPVEVTFDGITSFSMSTGDVFRIRLSQKKFCSILLTRHNYFSTLRTKLGWAGKLRL